MQQGLELLEGGVSEKERRGASPAELATCARYTTGQNLGFTHGERRCRDLPGEGDAAPASRLLLLLLRLLRPPSI